MAKHIFFTVTLVFISSFVFAQEWGSWEHLYSDNDISVDIKFKIEPNGCAENKNNIFQYRVEGLLNTFSDYLVWTTDYIDCNGQIVFQDYSLDITIGNKLSNGNAKAYGDTWTTDEAYMSSSVVRKFYGVKRQQMPSHNHGPQIPKKSTQARNIEGDSVAFYGVTTTFYVSGGQLGPGANWVWYDRSCGENPIGTGSSLNVIPRANTTYYVRAEGLTDTTVCVFKKVHVVSKSAESIDGGGEIKLDNPTILSVSGGSLMPSYKWVWYEGDCGGKRIGDGASIQVMPTTNTTYYVRGESKAGVTRCTRTDVSIMPRDPVAVIGTTDVQLGQSTRLTVNGGYLGSDDNWVWHENSCGGKRIGAGEYIDVTPIENTTYYVRSEGKNPVTKCAYINVNSSRPFEYAVNDNTVKIDRLDFHARDNKVYITYKIKNAKASDLFDVSVKGYSNGGELKLSSVYGAVDRVTGKRKKTIVWNTSKDGYNLGNEKVIFNISANVRERVPLIPHFTKSVIFPGWGDIHMRNRKGRLAFGLIGYGLVASSVILNQLAHQNYDSYKSISDAGQRNQLYKSTVSDTYASISCAAVAGLFWTIDLAGIITRRSKIRHNLSYKTSDYYYKRSGNTINAFSDAKQVNTK